MSESKWFPGTRADRHVLIAKTATFMSDPENRATIGFATTTPSGAWFDTAYAPKSTIYEAAYQKWADPATNSSTALDNLKDSEKEFFPIYRTFYGAVKGSPLVSNASLEEMGFPPRPSGGHSPHPVDKLFVDINASPMGNYTIRVTFVNRDTGKSNVPDYLTGVVIYYVVSSTPIENPADLAFSRLATRAPYELTLDPALQGKTLYLAGRWQNARGELGPWSSIIKIIVP
ncbi:MAG: hypothetical protein LBL07_01990 [Tannerella sp.]|jgi:hypothetical protein|nr:hypothetical protein [Tannerella sp.]